jgi:6-phosphogluconolactonase
MAAPVLEIYADHAHMNRAVADRVVELAERVLRERGSFFVALSGGSTPRALYQLLASPEYVARLDWAHVHVFFGDERCVPLDHPDSNYRMANESMLRRVPVPPEQVYPMCLHPESPTEEAARYSTLLKTRLPESHSGVPEFDLILLGLGEDGHTASLFPGTDILNDRREPVAAVYVEKLGSWRVSITYPVIDHARHVLFLVAGENKAPTLNLVFREPLGEPLPVQRIEPRGEVEWHVDQAAAQALEGGEES